MTETYSREKSYLGTDSARRKGIPLAAGLLDYFPDALAAVAEHSRKGNDKHNPGEPLHHARGKSMDHADCIMRHLSNRGGMDGDSRETVALAWRALALCQEELEQAYGLPLPRGARAPAVTAKSALQELEAMAGDKTRRTLHPGKGVRGAA